MERDFNALMYTILTTLQAVTERHGEDAVVPLLTQLQEVLTPLMQRPAAEGEEVANALEQVAIERRRAALEVGGRGALKRLACSGSCVWSSRSDIIPPSLLAFPARSPVLGAGVALINRRGIRTCTGLTIPCPELFPYAASN